MWPFKRRDYLKDGDRATKKEVVDAIFKILGKNSPAPNGAFFSRKHIEAMMSDNDGNVMTLENVKSFDFKFCHTLISWLLSLFDCDNLTAEYCVNVAKGAVKCKWLVGAWVFDLWYVSKSLRKEGEGKWSGYHSAPAWLFKLPGGGWWMIIRQPETFSYGGSWADPNDEVLFWVAIEGRN